MKKTFLLLFLIPIILFSQNKNSLQSKIDKILKDDYFKSTEVAIDIFDLTSKEILYRHNEKLLMHPASNMKILTTSAGLIFLGPDYNFSTSLYYSGEIVDSTLYGDLYAVGGCDPDFKLKDLDSMVVEFKNIGINKITGNIYGDVSMMDSIFWGKGWMWDDDPSTDAPYMTALNINDNAIQVNVEVKNKIPEVKLNPDTKYVDLKFNSFVGDYENTNPIIIDRDWINRKNTILINQDLTLPAPNAFHTSETVNVWQPEFYFLKLLEESLQNQNINYNGINELKNLPDTAKIIFSISRSFDSVIVNLNKTSDNLSAEMTLRAMSEKYFGKPASAKNGLKLIDSLIANAGLNPDDYRLVDGSGVSHYNLVSAELLLTVLKYIYEKRPDLYNILYNSFPNAGIDGSLESRMINTSAQNNVHAKTGTLSGVSTLSGFATSKKGDQIVFSILLQNFVGSSKKAREIQDAICEMMTEY